MKVSELMGAQFDYWVGAAEKLVVEIKDGVCFLEVPDGKRDYAPPETGPKVGKSSRKIIFAGMSKGMN